MRLSAFSRHSGGGEAGVRMYSTCHGTLGKASQRAPTATGACGCRLGGCDCGGSISLTLGGCVVGALRGGGGYGIQLVQLYD